MNPFLRAVVIVPVLGALTLFGCSDNKADTSVAVTGTDDACDLAGADLAAGTIGFDFTNDGGEASELYVLRENDDIVGEVENVGPGITRTLTVDLVAGTYQVRCKPGQSGEGISQAFTVTGEGGTALVDPDRTVTFDAVDFTYEDLDLSGISAGDTIRFEMTNSGTQPHEFEVLSPEDDAIGEVAALDVGESGGATVTFEKDGTYEFQCILKDPETGELHTMLGMSGTFEVSPAS